MKRSICSLAALLMCLGSPATPLSAAQPGGFTDAAEYCRVAGNADRPGAPYRGPKYPGWMIHALDAGSFPAAGLDWRCMNGRVLACFDYGTSLHCGKADTNRTPWAGLHEWCRANPHDTSPPPTAVTGTMNIYRWGCRNGRPVVLGQHGQVDARGYPAGLYQDVTAFAPTASVDPGTAITTDGMLGIRVGMTVRQIAHLIKQPGTYSQGEGVNTYECQIYDVRSDLAQVTVQRGAVTSIATNSPRPSTPAGARVGMSEANLRRMYGPRLLRGEQNSYNENGPDYYFYSTSGNGIKFGIVNGKVQFIAAGHRSSIDLSEGCY